MVKISFVIIAIGIAIGSYFLLNRSQIATQPLIENISGIISQTPAPTPFLFQEMTIPYLRKQTFSSQLSNLQRISENSNYTSYTTSYSSDGLKINGLLTQPKGNTPEGGWPAIVFIHGYIPPAEYRTTQNYVSYVDSLAKSGFVVFKIDLRGHGQSEGEAGGGYYSSDYVIDTLNAYSALENSSFVNPDKIGLWGHSMAGNIVMRTSATKPEIPAVVVWAGAGFTYSDISEFGIDDNSYQPPPQDTERARKRQQLRDLYGDFDPNSEFWKQVVPTNYLNDFRGAVSLHHAIDDNVVGIEYSRNLNSLLDKTDVIHELNEYPSGGHNLTGSSFSSAMQKTVEFYKRSFNL